MSRKRSLGECDTSVSRMGEDLAPKQFEARSPMGVPLEQFQAVHSAFGLPLTAGQAQGSDDRFVVLSYPTREANPFCDLAARSWPARHLVTPENG